MSMSPWLQDALVAREAAGTPIRVGLIGAGAMGKGIALQIAAFTQGMRLSAVANRSLARAADAVQLATGQAGVAVDTPVGLERAARSLRTAVTEDPFLVTRSPSVDVVVEATGSLEFAARVVVDAIEHGKDVVLMNAELDGTVGLALYKRAGAAGVVYTNADGDQPGAIMDLYRFAAQIGLQPVLCGNIKGMLDRYRTPDTQAVFAAQWNQNAHMATSFADGTKLAFEQAVVANATGSRLLAPGMLGPAVAAGTPIETAVAAFPVDRLLEGGCAVDYVLGAHPGPGVFVLATCEHPLQRTFLDYYKLGTGPIYCLYRPFHLCHFEVPITIAQAALARAATIRPSTWAADVVCVAKRQLPAGTRLDGIGGFDLYGLVEEAAVASRGGLLPIGLSDGAVLRRTVRIDERIGIADVDLPEGRLLDVLRTEQSMYPRRPPNA